MPVVVPFSGYGYNVAVTAKTGVTLTSGGASHVMGAWTTLLSNVPDTIFGILVNAAGTNVAGGDGRGLMDIGITAPGDTEPRVVIPILDVGAAASVTLGGKTYFFPLFAPAGSTISGRWQSFTANDTMSVIAHAYTSPAHGFSEAPLAWVNYGNDPPSSGGVVFTSGNGTWGTAVEVTGGAGTSRDHRFFHVGIGWGTNTAVTAGRYRVRLSRDSAGTSVIGYWDFTAPDANETINGPLNPFPICCPVPAGSLLYASAHGAAAESMTVGVLAA